VAGVVAPALRRWRDALLYRRLLEAVSNNPKLPSADAAAAQLGALIEAFALFCEGDLRLPMEEVLASCRWGPDELAQMVVVCEDCPPDAAEAADWAEFYSLAWRTASGDRAALARARALVEAWSRSGQGGDGDGDGE